MPRPWPERGFATPADLAACREMLRAGSRTFFAASLLLPGEVREPASSLYAFCRLADDAVDVEGGRLEVLARLRERLHGAYIGRPFPAAIDRALADVLARHEIPPALPEALLEGFAWDSQGRRYEDLPQLFAYAARVAGTVGAMMALLMGVRARETVGRACELGVAMQLSNIARDVGEDARAGRLYLPLRWLREAGIEPEAWLARPRFTPALGLVVERLLGVADALYRRADGGIDRLPLVCRPAIHAARLLYAEIGREVQRRDLDSVTQRAVVPLPRKLALLARAVLVTVLSGEGEVTPPLDEVRFLVEAAASAPRRRAEIEAAQWSMDHRIAWLIDLFGRLERRGQVGSSGGGA
jgi:phytoene synthase